MTRVLPRALLPYAAVALAAGSWGAWALVIRHAEAIAPMPAALESTIVMAVITVVAGLASLRDRAAAPRTWKAWACVGWFGIADLFNVLLFFAAYKLTIAVAVLTHYLTPVFVALMAPLVLREKMTVRTGLAIAVSFFGLAVMLAPSGPGASATVVWTSAALGSASAVFYASNVLVNKFVVGAFSTSQAMFWHGVVATLVGLAMVPPGAWTAVDPHAVGFLAVVAIGPGALGGLAFVWGLRRMPAAHASTLTLLEPVVSLVLGAGVLGERVGALAVLGGALILTGAVLVMTQARPAIVTSEQAAE
ncbi:MAG TPA: DMT family transporter [Polyangiaceae bacterium]|nr:DMT family transporter [Polyangiaceae bacterium]